MHTKWQRIVTRTLIVPIWMTKCQVKGAMGAEAAHLPITSSAGSAWPTSPSLKRLGRTQAREEEKESERHKERWQARGGGGQTDKE